MSRTKKRSLYMSRHVARGCREKPYIAFVKG